MDPKAGAPPDVEHEYVFRDRENRMVDISELIDAVLAYLRRDRTVNCPPNQKGIGQND